MDSMSDADATVLDRIRTAPQAFVAADDLGDVAGLEARGLVQLWHRPDFTAATLTPLGAARLGVEIAERWAFQPAEGEDGGRTTVAYEEPYWTPKTDQPRRPLSSLRHAHEVPLPCPDRVPDHRAGGPDYLTDAVSGEPVTLWGRRVPVDKRLGKGRKTGGRKAG